MGCGVEVLPVAWVLERNNEGGDKRKGATEWGGGGWAHAYRS